jgi:uncharacterized protein (DUF1501 family)
MTGRRGDTVSGTTTTDPATDPAGAHAAATADGCGCGTGPSRRSVLRAAATAGALGVAATAAGEAAATRYAFGAEGYTGDVLVVLSLHGGFDGLNAIVPAGDPDYLRLRPTIGIPSSSLLPLSGIFGLHPALAPLLPFWQAGTFAAVHAVGQADASRSHFQAMAELERAAPGSSLRTGWLDRTVGLRPRGTAFQAAQVGQAAVNAALAGPTPELSLRSVDGFDLSGAWDARQRTLWTRALSALHRGAPAAIAAPAAGALGAVGTTSRLKAAGYTPAEGAAYPTRKDGGLTSLGGALRDVARLVKAKVGLQVACVDVGDWDMHEGMGTVDDGWLRRKLAELGQAMAAFATDLGPALDGVTLVTLSEFGRRVAENGTGGVDHGFGNAVLLLGGGVAGGQVHGRWPGLGPKDLLSGDLAGTVDYRVLLAEILTKRCGLASATAVFPGLTGTPLGVARARTT